MTTSIDSICVLRLSAIGDVCNAVAAVQKVQALHPDSRLVWIIGAIEHQLVGDLPGIDFVVLDKRRGWRGIREALRQAGGPFDVLLHMQLSFRANLIARLLPAKRKIGFPKHLQKELHGWVINDTAAMPGRPHVLEGFLAFAKALGAVELEPTWQIPIPPDARTYAERVAPAGKAVLVISPAASAPQRSWLADRYAAVARHAMARGVAVIVTGGPAAHDRELGESIAVAAGSGIVNITGQTSVKQLLALLARADLVIAPDTGPAHMATSQGTPVIGLYAHSNPERTGPYNSRDIVVSGYDAAIREQTGRSATEVKWGTRAKGDSLMASISVDDVIARVDSLLAIT